MKIRIRQNKFYCSPKDYCILAYYKLILFLKRTKRRILMGFTREKVLIYFIIIVLWILFCGIIFYIEKFIIKNQCSSLISEIYNARFIILSSVIIPFTINSYNDMLTYKKNLSAQYELFSNFQYQCYKLIIDVMGDTYLDCDFFATNELKNYETIRIESNYKPPKTKNVIETDIDNIKSLINDVSKKANANELYCLRNSFIFSAIDSAKYDIDNFNKDMSYENFSALLSSLFAVNRQLRRIWRVDKDINIKITRILLKYPSNTNSIYHNYMTQLPEYIDNYSYYYKQI